MLCIITFTINVKRHRTCKHTLHIIIISCDYIRFGGPVPLGTGYFAEIKWGIHRLHYIYSS